MSGGQAEDCLSAELDGTVVGVLTTGGKEFWHGASTPGPTDPGPGPSSTTECW